MPPQSPLLIVSIGNPSQKYAGTLHSAGHTVLSAIQTILWRSHTEFGPHRGGEISTGIPAKSGQMGWLGMKHREKRPADERDWTLWKSGSLMNISGKGVRDVWAKWRAAEEGRTQRGRLVVLHDELERDLGVLRVSEGSASARYSLSRVVHEDVFELTKL
jgi:peptidyl-tRNA hydrolase, PTH1 family